MFQFEKASTPQQQCDWFIKLNDHRFVFETALNNARIKYFQDMENVSSRKEYTWFSHKEVCYEKLTASYYQSLIDATFRNYLEDRWGKQLFRLAELKQDIFSKKIEEDLQKEKQLIINYQSLIGKAGISFKNQSMNFSELAPFLNSPDRLTRKNAHHAKSQFFSEIENDLDEILNELVKTRNDMATKLGYHSFIELGYKRMNRTAHTPTDLATYRNQVRKNGVPFVEQLRQAQRNRIDVGKIKYYDEGYLSPEPAPVPNESTETILEKFHKMFSEISPETEAFFEEISFHHSYDIEGRPAKMSGNFASYLGQTKQPFLFLNLNGTANDIRVLAHETGHAFQFFMARHWNIPEYIIPYDSAELFSFGMELLVWPWMDRFFGKDTKRYQLEHLIGGFMYMPLASAVDEFEHYLYSNTSATIEDRKDKWRELEREYLPERDYDGNDFLEKGTSFYEIGHLFTTPFYFMDYDLAHFLAVQLWKRQQENSEVAWKDYLNMCRNGGKLPLKELINQANIKSPFDENSLQPLLNYVQHWIRKACE
ncbi:M3 family oligoendopeptidase [Sediminibacillus dalangtanensis]|uniref:M3 family oligoendopeptidase n=1 Tax=Sediminibacillus dalangtanensis TaxID=2729421 RepID=A0ABX7VYA3_9BACI|nr:M3 family oligoendopeptidase [Sediminibacillus dalangtanensis]